MTTGGTWREAELPWLGGRRFWLVLLALLLLAATVLFAYERLLAGRTAPTQEAFLYGQPELSPGRASSFKVLVRNGETSAPIPGAQISVEIRDGDAPVAWSTELRSGPDGLAHAEVLAPAHLPDGDYTLYAGVRSPEGRSEVSHAVSIQRHHRVLVSTDKPLYQPGQVVHMRALALGTHDLKPAGDQAAVLMVQDAKGNKVFKKSLKTSAFGIAAADFTLADQVNLGEYRVTATVNDTSSERTVRVERYRLPKFKISLGSERGYYGPGDVVEIDVDAQYTWGEPVAGGSVELVAAEFVEQLTPFATLSGVTGPDGRLHLRVPLGDHFVGQARTQGDATVSVEATVTDRAGHVQKRTLELTVSSQPLRVELFPESGQLVPGVANEVFVLTAYPDGRPAQCTVVIQELTRTLETNEAGIARFTLEPNLLATQRGEAEAQGVDAIPLSLTVADRQGLRVELSAPLRVDHRARLLLRTDRALYRAGQTAQISVFSSEGEGRVFVDVVQGRQTALTKAIDIRGGRGSLVLDLPTDLFGTLELHAYRITPSGEIAGDERIIQVARATDLQIRATLDRDVYRPAEKALLRVAVSRTEGEPVVAALSLSGVDEAVFALQEARPGLERIYFMLQEELLKPRYQLATRPAVSAAQAFSEMEQLPPTQAEASRALFSVAKGQAPPARAASELFHQRQARFTLELQAYKAKLWAAAALLPFGIFGLIALAILGLAAKRLFARTPLSEARDEERRALRLNARGAIVWWVLGLYLPVVTAAISAKLANALDLYHLAGWFAGIVGGLFLLYCFWRQLRRVRAFLRQPAATALPLTRRVLVALPALHGTAYVAVLAAIAAANLHPRVFNEETAAILVLLTLATAVLLSGAVSALVQGVIESTSSLRYLWLLVSRPLFAGIPLLLVAAAAIPSFAPMGAAPPPMVEMALERARAPREEGGVRLTADALAMAMPGTTEKPADSAKLKAPTRVRRHFPETLLWRPELITDEGGEASLEIPLADSITTWRLAMSAVSQLGELGAATLGLRVFQDFFVDIDFPVALTQNDRVSVPLAIYNYLDKPQTVRIEVQPATWFAMQGPTSHTLSLAAREVTSVPLTLVAKKPGTHALQVKAFGSAMADAVERTVRVKPDGEPVDVAFSGRMEGTIRESIDIPADAIKDASRILVRLYPGAFSQVVGGMESLLRLPGG